MNRAQHALNRLQAGRLLHLMDISEATAARLDTAQTEMLRQAITLRYRQLIGVEPAQRHSFRAALEHVHEQGGMTVQELITYFHDQSSMLLPSTSGSATTTSR